MEDVHVINYCLHDRHSYGKKGEKVLMRMSVLTKKGMAIVMTAAMLIASVSTGFADEVDVTEFSDEAVQQQENASVESTVAGFDDSAFTDDDIVLAEEEFSIEEDSDQEEEVFPEKDSSDDVLEAGIIEEEVLTAQEEYHDLYFEYSYGYQDNAYLYTDKKLTMTVFDSETGEEIPADTYSVKWTVLYKKYGMDPEFEKPDFITEYEDGNTLTLEADPDSYEEDYYLNVSAMIYTEDGQNCGACSDSVSVYKERCILNDQYEEGNTIELLAGESHWLDESSVKHYYSEAHDGEYIDCDILGITAEDPSIIETGSNGNSFYFTGLKEGTTEVTFTLCPSGSGDEFDITCIFNVTTVRYYLNLYNSIREDENTATVLPGMLITVTAEINGTYYENGENQEINDFSGITYQWSVQDENGSEYPYSEISGGINIQTEEVGAYTVLCRALKDGKQIAGRDWNFNVNEQYYELDFEAYQYDIDAHERGDVIDLQNQFQDGTAAVVIPSLMQYSTENPDGVSLEDYEYALRTWDSSIEDYSFYSYSEETGIGEPIDLPYDEYVALSGDGFVISRNGTAPLYWQLYAYEHFDPENQDNYIAYQGNNINWWNEYQYDNSENMFFEPSYGDEEEGLMLYEGYPLTLTLRDYSDETDYSECDVEWSVEYEHVEYNEEEDESETIYVPAYDWVTWESDANQITLTAREDRPNERESIQVTAKVHKDGKFLGEKSRNVYILAPSSGLEIDEFINLEQEYYVGDNEWIPVWVTAYSDTASGYEEESAKITNLTVDAAESDAGVISISHESDDAGWEIICKAEGKASLIATYIDPFTDEERTYSFGFLIRDNVDYYEIEIEHDKESSYILNNETVTLSYKVTAEHISGGERTTIPETAYRVEWSVSPEEYVTTQEDASGRLTVTTHFTEDFYDFDAPELRIFARVFEADAEEGTEPVAESSEEFYPKREYYNVTYAVETPSGLDLLEFLPVGETAAVTPVVKHYDSEHMDGELVSNDSVGFFNFSFDPECLEVKAADGSVIEQDFDDDSDEITQTPYITVKRLNGESTDLEFDCCVLVEDDESLWETVGRFDSYFHDAEGKVLVTLYSNGGFFDDEERKEVVYELVDEEEMITADDLSWPDYDGDKVFAGWAAIEDPDIEDIILPADEDDVTVPASELSTLYAVWKDAIAITWDPNGGKWNYVGRYGEGLTEPRKEKYAVGDNPWGAWVDREGYALLGWSLDRNDSEHIYAEAGRRFKLPDTATTLYAQWAPGYKVTFNGNGGYTNETYPSIETSQMVPAGQPVDSYSNFFYEGMAMNGWALDAAGTQMVDIWTYKITQDTTFYAQWTPGYKVTFELGAGRLSYNSTADSFSEMFIAGSELYTRSYSYNLVPPSGMAFMGWSTKENDESGLITDGNPLKINSNKTVYAIYAEACEVVFDANGGFFIIEGIEEETCTENYPKGRALDDLYIPSYPDDTKVLLGFSTTKDRKDLVFNWYLWNQDYLITENQTLYAIWVPKHKIVYDGNGKMIGRGGSREKIEYDWPEDEGYYGWQNDIIPEDLRDEFSGWSTSPTGWPLFDFENAKVTSDMTFYAVWGEVVIPKYPVTYEFISSTGEEIPGDALRMMRALVPADREYVDDTQVDAVDLTGKTVEVDNGHWTFVSYDKDSAVIEGGPVVFTSTWTFTEETAAVEYVFVSETSGEEIPEKVEALKPRNTTAVKGTTVDPERPDENSVEDGNYNWIFLGYEPASAKAGGEGSKITFTGKWRKVEKEKNTYFITYKFAPDNLPEAVMALLPAKTAVVEGEKPVCAALTRTSVAVTTGEEGNWVFDGFNTDSLPESMSEDIPVTGTWHFETKAEAADTAAGMISDITGGTDVDSNSLIDALDKADSADVLDQLTENLKDEAGDDQDALNELLADTTTQIDDLLVNGDKITVSTGYGSQTVGAYVSKTIPATDAATGVKVDISGAAATVASVIRNMDTATLMENDSDHYQAEVSIQNVEDTGEKLTLDISLNVENIDTGEVVKNVEPTSPVTITLTLPEDYVGYDLTVIHTNTDGSTETIKYSFISGDTQIRFTVSSLSPFKLEKVPAEHVERLEPTCAEAGHIEYWKRRGKMYDAADNELTASDIIIPKTGAHAWDAGKVTKAATEDVTGIRTFTCKVCHTKKTAVIPKVKVKITIKSKPAKFKAKKEKKGKVTLTWKKLSKSGKKNKALFNQVKSIEIQYTTDKNFATGVVKKSLSKKKAKLKLKLKPKTTYYIRIRYADGKGGYSQWVMKTVKTKK